MKVKAFRWRTVAGLGAGVVVAAVAGAGVTTAATAAQDVVHGCVGRVTGILRVIDPAAGGACTQLENPLDFNQQGPAGTPGQQGGPGPPGEPATRYFAHVTQDGQLEYGSGVTEVNYLGNASYQIRFGRDVSRCVGVASIGGNGFNQRAYAAAIIANHDFSFVNSFVVRIVDPTDPDAPQVDAAFNFVVFC